MSWDEYFINLLSPLSIRSKDESQKLGAVIVGKDKQIISTGYNSFPRGIKDDIPERQDRPLKYHFMAHAEENAIVNAALNGSSTKDSRLYVSWWPCSACARMIVNAGISVVVLQYEEIYDRWYDSCNCGRRMFEESGVDVFTWDGELRKALMEIKSIQGKP